MKFAGKRKQVNEVREKRFNEWYERCDVQNREREGGGMMTMMQIKINVEEEWEEEEERVKERENKKIMGRWLTFH